MSQLSFKPYYKWITFNTEEANWYADQIGSDGFKPYYKWITFNTKSGYMVSVQDILKF